MASPTSAAAAAPSASVEQTPAQKAADKAAKAAKALRKSYQQNHPLYLWWTVAAVIGLFILVNLIRIGHQQYRRRRALKLAKASSEKTEFASASAARPGVATRSVNALVTATNKTFSWREVTVSLWWKVSAGEMFWSIMYTFVVLLLGLLHLPIRNTTRLAQAQMVGNRCGILAFSQTPLIVGLASKNNVISYLTGISYEKLNFLHRAAGRACLILSWIHTIDRGMIIGLKGKHAITTWEMQMGVVALLAYSLLVASSLKPLLRRVAYEAFLISHIVLALIFLISAYFHWEEFGYWVWPSFVIWGFDRIARLVNMLVLNKFWLSLRPSSTNFSAVATVKLLPGDAIELKMTRSMRWFAGQHAYVVCPTVSKFPFEAHPFTIASIPKADGPSEVSFIISQRDGFTKRLGEIARAGGGTAEITACIDGPYGYVRSLDSFESVVLLAGGSGISYTAGLLSQIVRDCKAGKSAVKHVSFIWVVRTTDQIDWIAASLAKDIRDCPASLNIDLQIFVTRNTLPIAVLNEKAGGLTGSSGPSSRNSSDEISPNTASPSSPDIDEKKAGPTPSALLFATSLHEGRPDLGPLLREAVTNAGSSALAINVCGPHAMSSDVKRALRENATAFSLGDVATGKVGHVSLHCEAFGW